MANISGWTTVLSLLARFAAHSGAFNAAFNTVTFVLMDTSYISKQNFTLFLSVLVSLALVSPRVPLRHRRPPPLLPGPMCSFGMMSCAASARGLLHPFGTTFCAQANSGESSKSIQALDMLYALQTRLALFRAPVDEHSAALPAALTHAEWDELYMPWLQTFTRLVLDKR